MNYSLEIVSKKENKKYKQFKLEDIETIGVFDNEAFKIRFRNNTHQRVQIRISVDGTDVVTGKEATLDTTGQMWLVEGYGHLDLDAWPETESGGAEFLFTEANDSVAKHTHGNMSAKGLIAAAVFVESEYTYKVPDSFDNFRFDGIVSPYEFTDSFSLNEDKIYISSNTRSVNKNIGVGAGSYVEQTITKTAGLTNPKLSKIVTVKYEFWPELRKKIRPEPAHPAFPGSAPKPLMNIGSTPRKEARRVTRRKKIENRYTDINRFAS